MAFINHLMLVVQQEKESTQCYQLFHGWIAHLQLHLPTKETFSLWGQGMVTHRLQVGSTIQCITHQVFVGMCPVNSDFFCRQHHTLVYILNRLKWYVLIPQTTIYLPNGCMQLFNNWGRTLSSFHSDYSSANDRTTVSPTSCLTSLYLIMECSPRTCGVLSTILNELGRGWP